MFSIIKTERGGMRPSPRAQGGHWTRWVVECSGRNLQPHFFPWLAMDLSTPSSPTVSSSRPWSTQCPAAPTSPGSWTSSWVTLTGPGWAWWVLTMATLSGWNSSCSWRWGTLVAASQGRLEARATASSWPLSSPLALMPDWSSMLLPPSLQGPGWSSLGEQCDQEAMDPLHLLLLWPLSATPKILDFLNGSLNLAKHSGIMPVFTDFLLALRPAMYPGSSLVRKLWEELHGCRWPGSGASTQSAREGAQKHTELENVTAVHLSAFKLPGLTIIYQAYLAAKDLLTAFYNLMSCSPGEEPFLGGTYLCQGTECQALAGEQPKSPAQSLSIPACCEPQTSREAVWSSESCAWI